MRRLVVVVAVSTVFAFVAGRMSVQVPANAEGRGVQGAGAGTPKGNGDVNGDGALNLTDAIYVLQHLFQGGPAPVPIEGPKPGQCALPATGQTKCYEYGEPGNEIPCNSPDFPGQDGFYQTGCPSQGRFVDNQDGTVTDNCTGLMWQKDTADVNGDGTIDPAWGGPDTPLWRDALRYCESLSFAGHDDWRLPNLRELTSIVDYWRSGPVIDRVFGALSADYWSSSADAGSPWLVNFGVGDVGKNTFFIRGGYCHVRAVRTIQPGE